MAGGLLQLIASGIEDAPLIQDPEITFFKTVYLRHGNFSLIQNKSYLGKKKLGQLIEIDIGDIGDLLSQVSFDVEIPKFTLDKTIETNTTTLMVKENNKKNEIYNKLLNLVDKINYIFFRYTSESDSYESITVDQSYFDSYYNKKTLKISDIVEYDYLLNLVGNSFYDYSTTSVWLPSLLYRIAYNQTSDAQHIETSYNTSHSLVNILTLFSDSWENFIMNYTRENSVYFGNLLTSNIYRNFLLNKFNDKYITNYCNNFTILNNKHYYNIIINGISEIDTYKKIINNSLIELNNYFDTEKTYRHLEDNNLINENILINLSNTYSYNYLFIKQIINILFSSDSSLFRINLQKKIKSVNSLSDNIEDINLTYTKKLKYIEEKLKQFIPSDKILNLPIYDLFVNEFYSMVNQSDTYINGLDNDILRRLYNICYTYQEKMDNSIDNTDELSFGIDEFVFNRDKIIFTDIPNVTTDYYLYSVSAFPNVDFYAIKIISIKNEGNQYTLTLESNNGLANISLNDNIDFYLNHTYQFSKTIDDMSNVINSTNNFDSLWILDKPTSQMKPGMELYYKDNTTTENLFVGKISKIDNNEYRIDLDSITSVEIFNQTISLNSRLVLKQSKNSNYIKFKSLNNIEKTYKINSFYLGIQNFENLDGYKVFSNRIKSGSIINSVKISETVENEVSFKLNYFNKNKIRLLVDTSNMMVGDYIYFNSSVDYYSDNFYIIDNIITENDNTYIELNKKLDLELVLLRNFEINTSCYTLKRMKKYNIINLTEYLGNRSETLNVSSEFELELNNRIYYENKYIGYVKNIVTNSNNGTFYNYTLTLEINIGICNIPVNSTLYSTKDNNYITVLQNFDDSTSIDVRSSKSIPVNSFIFKENILLGKVKSISSYGELSTDYTLEMEMFVNGCKLSIDTELIFNTSTLVNITDYLVVDDNPAVNFAENNYFYIGLNQVNFMGSNNDKYNQDFSFYNKLTNNETLISNLTNFPEVDLSMIYSYLVYIIEENLYENDYFSSKPYYLTFWRNTINGYIFDRYRKLKAGSLEGLELDQTFYNFNFTLNSNHFINFEMIKDYFKVFSRGENYFGIINLNYDDLTTFENTYLNEIDLTFNNETSKISYNLDNSKKLIDLSTSSTTFFNVRSDNINNGNPPYIVDLINNRIIVNEWFYNVSNTSKFRIEIPIIDSSILIFDYNIDYRINYRSIDVSSFEKNDNNQLILNFEEKLNFFIEDEIDYLMDNGLKYYVRIGNESNSNYLLSVKAVTNNGLIDGFTCEIGDPNFENTYYALSRLKVGMMVSSDNLDGEVYIISIKKDSNSINVRLSKTFNNISEDDNVSLVIVTYFKLIEENSLEVPLVKYKDEYLNFNDVSESIPKLDFKANRILIYNRERLDEGGAGTCAQRIFWSLNINNDIYQYMYFWAPELHTHFNLDDTNLAMYYNKFLVYFVYENEQKSILTRLIRASSTSNYYYFNMENTESGESSNFFSQDKLLKIYVYQIPSIVQEYDVLTSQFDVEDGYRALVTLSSKVDNLNNLYGNENNFNYNKLTDEMYLKIQNKEDKEYGFYEIVDSDIDFKRVNLLKESTNNISFNITFLVDIGKIVDNINKDRSNSINFEIVIIKNNYNRRVLPNLYDLTSLGSLSDLKDNYSKLPYIFYQKTSGAELPLMYLYNMPFSLAGNCDLNHKTRRSVRINGGDESFIISQIGNSKTLLKPINYAEEDSSLEWRCLNGIDYFSFTDTFYNVIKEKKLSSKYEIREYIIKEQLSKIDSLVESDELLKIVENLDNIQEEYMLLFVNIIKKLESKVGITSTKVYDNLKIINNNISLDTNNLYENYKNYYNIATDIFGTNNVLSTYSVLNSALIPYQKMEFDKKINLEVYDYLDNYGKEILNQISELNKNQSYLNKLNYTGSDKSIYEHVNLIKYNYYDKIETGNYYYIEINKYLDLSSTVTIDDKIVQILDINNINNFTEQNNSTFDLDNMIYEIYSENKLNNYLVDKFTDVKEYQYIKNSFSNGFFNYLGIENVISGNKNLDNGYTAGISLTKFSEYIQDQIEEGDFLLINDYLYDITKIDDGYLFLDKFDVGTIDGRLSNVYLAKNNDVKKIYLKQVSVDYSDFGTKDTDSRLIKFIIPGSVFEKNPYLINSSINPTKYLEVLKSKKILNSFIKLTGQRAPNMWFKIVEVSKINIDSSLSYKYSVTFYANVREQQYINTTLDMSLLQDVTIVFPYEMLNLNRSLNLLTNRTNRRGLSGIYNSYYIDNSFRIIDKVNIIKTALYVDKKYDKFLMRDQRILVISYSSDNNYQLYYGSISSRLSEGIYQISPPCSLESGILRIDNRFGENKIKINGNLSFRNGRTYFYLRRLINNNLSNDNILNVINLLNPGDIIRTYVNPSNIATIKNYKVLTNYEDVPDTNTNTIGYIYKKRNQVVLYWPQSFLDSGLDPIKYIGQVISGTIFHPNTFILDFEQATSDTILFYLSKNANRENYDIKDSYEEYSLWDDSYKNSVIININAISLRPLFKKLNYESSVIIEDFDVISLSSLYTKNTDISLPQNFLLEDNNLFDSNNNKKYFKNLKLIENNKLIYPKILKNDLYSKRNNYQYYSFYYFIYIKTYLDGIFKLEGTFDILKFYNELMSRFKESSNNTIYELNLLDNEIEYKFHPISLELRYIDEQLESQYINYNSYLDLELGDENLSVTDSNIDNLILFSKLALNNKLKINESYNKINYMTLYQSDSDKKYYFRIYLKDKYEFLETNKFYQFEFYIPIKIDYSINNLELNLLNSKGNRFQMDFNFNIEEYFLFNNNKYKNSFDINRKINENSYNINFIKLDLINDIIISSYSDQFIGSKKSKIFTQKWYFYHNGKINFYFGETTNFYKFIKTLENYEEEGGLFSLDYNSDNYSFGLTDKFIFNSCNKNINETNYINYNFEVIDLKDDKTLVTNFTFENNSLSFIPDQNFLNTKFEILLEYNSQTFSYSYKWETNDYIYDYENKYLWINTGKTNLSTLYQDSTQKITVRYFPYNYITTKGNNYSEKHFAFEIELNETNVMYYNSYIIFNPSLFNQLHYKNVDESGGFPSFDTIVGVIQTNFDYYLTFETEVYNFKLESNSDIETEKTEIFRFLKNMDLGNSINEFNVNGKFYYNYILIDNYEYDLASKKITNDYTYTFETDSYLFFKILDIEIKNTMYTGTYSFNNDNFLLDSSNNIVKGVKLYDDITLYSDVDLRETKVITVEIGQIGEYNGGYQVIEFITSEINIVNKGQYLKGDLGSSYIYGVIQEEGFISVFVDTNVNMISSTGEVGETVSLTVESYSPYISSRNGKQYLTEGDDFINVYYQASGFNKDTLNYRNFTGTYQINEIELVEDNTLISWNNEIGSKYIFKIYLENNEESYVFPNPIDINIKFVPLYKTFCFLNNRIPLYLNYSDTLNDSLHGVQQKDSNDKITFSVLIDKSFLDRKIIYGKNNYYGLLDQDLGDNKNNVYFYKLDKSKELFKIKLYSDLSDLSSTLRLNRIFPIKLFKINDLYDFSIDEPIVKSVKKYEPELNNKLKIWKKIGSVYNIIEFKNNDPYPYMNRINKYHIDFEFLLEPELVNEFKPDTVIDTLVRDNIYLGINSTEKIKIYLGYESNNRYRGDIFTDDLSLKDRLQDFYIVEEYNIVNLINNDFYNNMININNDNLKIPFYSESNSITDNLSVKCYLEKLYESNNSGYELYNQNYSTSNNDKLTFFYLNTKLEYSIFNPFYNVKSLFLSESNVDFDWNVNIERKILLTTTKKIPLDSNNMTNLFIQKNFETDKLILDTYEKLSVKNVFRKIQYILLYNKEFKKLLLKKLKPWKTWNKINYIETLKKRGNNQTIYFDVAFQPKNMNNNTYLDNETYFEVEEYNRLIYLTNKYLVNDTGLNSTSNWIVFKSLMNIEKKIVNNIFDMMESMDFWENISDKINTFLHYNRSSEDNNFDWVYYKGCLFTYNEYNDFLRTSILPDTILKNSNDNFVTYYRELYLDSQYNCPSFIIDRNSIDYVNQVNNHDDFYGVNIFDFFRELEILSVRINNLEEYLEENKDSLTNYQNIDLEMALLVIFGNKYKKYLSKLDMNVIDTLKIEYNLDENDILSGKIEDKNLKKTNIGINIENNLIESNTDFIYQNLGYEKNHMDRYTTDIKFSGLTTDSLSTIDVRYSDINRNFINSINEILGEFGNFKGEYKGKLYVNNYEIIKPYYKFVGINYIPYRIKLDKLLSSNIIFYEVDFLNEENLLLDIPIVIEENDVNYLEFKSEKNYKSDLDISLKAYQELEISNMNYLGKAFRFKFQDKFLTEVDYKLFDRITFSFKDVIFYKKNVYFTENTTQYLELITNPTLLINRSFDSFTDKLKLECTFYLKSYSIDNNITYLVFESIFDKFYDSALDHYFELNGKLFELKKISITNEYYFTNDGEDLSSIFNLSIYKYLKLYGVDETGNYDINKQTEFNYYKVKLNSELELKNGLKIFDLSKVPINLDLINLADNRIKYLNITKNYIFAELNKINIYIESIKNSDEIIFVTLNDLLDNNTTYKIHISSNIGESIQTKIETVENNDQLFAYNIRSEKLTNIEIKPEYILYVDEYYKFSNPLNMTNGKLLIENPDDYTSSSYGYFSYNLIKIYEKTEITSYELESNRSGYIKLIWYHNNSYIYDSKKIPTLVFFVNIGENLEEIVYTEQSGSNIMFIESDKNKTIFNLQTVLSNNEIVNINFYNSVYDSDIIFYLEQHINPKLFHFKLEDYNNWDYYQGHMVQFLSPLGEERGNYLYSIEITSSKELVRIKNLNYIRLLYNDKKLISGNNRKEISNYVDAYTYKIEKSDINGNIFILKLYFVTKELLLGPPDVLEFFYRMISLIIGSYLTSGIITRDDYIMDGSTMRYSFNDDTLSMFSGFKYLGKSYNNGEFYDFNTETNTISILYNSDATKYNFIGYKEVNDDETVEVSLINTLNCYLTGKKFDMKLENLFFTDIQNNYNINNQELNKIEKIETIVTEQPIFDNLISFNFIDRLEFYLGDQLIEKINNWSMYLNYQWKLDDAKKSGLEKIIKLREENNSYKFKIMLPLWFSEIDGNDLPLIALPYSKPRIKLYVQKLENLILNKDYQSKNMEFKITMDNDYVLLDDIEREKFAKYRHEYLIERTVIYPKSLLKSKSETVILGLKNLVKDIFFIFHPMNSETWTQSYYQKIEIMMDKWNKIYNEKLVEAKAYINSDREVAVDNDIITIFNLIENRDSFTTIINHMNEYFTSFILTVELQDLFLFLLTKMNFVPMEQGRNVPYGGYKYKFQNLLLYYTKMYMNKENKIKRSPVQELQLKANGSNLFSFFKEEYFSLLTAYHKFENTPEIGLLAHTFSLYPYKSDPSGHLNMNKFDEVVLRLKLDEEVETNNLNMNLIVKEYQILRIMSGIGALTW